MRLLITSAVAAGLFGGMGLAHATPIVQTQTVTTHSTTYTDNTSLSFFKFDTSLGTLNSVLISFTGNVLGDIKAESKDGSPAVVTLNVAAAETLKTPLGTTLGIALPTATQIFNATAYDGVDDFGGTSGITYTGLTNTDTVTGGPYFSGATFNEFVGLGSIVLSLNAVGTSGGTGAGNLLQQFATQAGASVTVTYDYTPVCGGEQNPCASPEPASMSLLGAGFVGLAAIIRRRRKI